MRNAVWPCQRPAGGSRVLMFLRVDRNPIKRQPELRRGNVEKLSIFLMIAAIVCALFSDQIDTKIKGDKKVKKVIIIFSIGILLVCTIAILASVLS